MDYTDQDLDDARQAGLLSQKELDNFRAFIKARQPDAGATADTTEEHFRLLTGFNDIFVSIACLLVLYSGWKLGAGIAEQLGALIAGLLSWGLAEYFTRIRRMALPSVLLLVMAVVSAFFAARFEAAQGLSMVSAFFFARPEGLSIAQPAAALLVAGLHWWRFRVPVTLAAAAGAAVMFVMILLTLLGLAYGSALFNALLIGQGLAILGLAVWWDSTDRLRTTRRTDIAFWLHLLAALLMVHPLLGPLARDGANPEAATIGGILGIYGVLILLSLLLDRRALMVSALGYALYAAAQLVRYTGQENSGFVLACLIFGGGLLMLSALWQPMRRLLMRAVPARLASLLPPV